MVARPVTFEIVANEAAVTFGVTFEMAFVAKLLPTTEIKQKKNTTHNFDLFECI